MDRSLSSQSGRPGAGLSLEGSPARDDPYEAFSFEGAEGAGDSASGYVVLHGQDGHGRELLTDSPLTCSQPMAQASFNSRTGEFGSSRHLTMIDLLNGLRTVASVTGLSMVSTVSTADERDTSRLRPAAS